MFLLQIPQWVRLGHDGRERVVGLNFNISELSDFLMRDGAVSLVNGRIQLMLTDADEEDFYGLNNLFLFVELVVDWRIRMTFIQTCEGTSCFVGQNLIFKCKRN